MTTLDTFQALAKEPFHQHLRTHKENGGKIIGIVCSYIPEEIFMAADMVPFRMRAVGSTKTTLGDSWFSSFNCSYVRRLFDLALEKQFHFLDGIIFMNSCDHMRRMYDNWKRGVDHPPFIHMTAVPHKRGEEAVAWYREELIILKEAVEKQFGLTISEQAVRDAIKTANQVRSLLGRIYDLRKSDSPPITGAETLSVVLAGTSLPRDQFAHMLDQLLEELPGRTVYPPGVPRMAIASGCLEEPEHIAVMEAQGCAVVDDAFCFGRRYFDQPVDEDLEDPFLALARRYMTKLSCPRITDSFEARMERINRSAEAYRLDGLICERLKFCDLWGGESFLLKHESKTSGLPMLALERELYLSGEGQLKTRIQAFLEQISAR